MLHRLGDVYHVPLPEWILHFLAWFDWMTKDPGQMFWPGQCISEVEGSTCAGRSRSHDREEWRDSP